MAIIDHLSDRNILSIQSQVNMASFKYSVYNAEFLRSKGLIITEDADLKLAIVRYHKSDNNWKNKTFGECNRDDPIVQRHRSVVYSTESGCVLHASQPRRKADSSVVIGSLKKKNWIASQYIDGTMISVFWNPSTSEWVLSSRSKIHAACKFMSDRLFRELFCDTLSCSLDEFLSRLDTDHSYTFVLCHPENKHVIMCDTPKIYLTQILRTVQVMKEDDSNESVCTPLSFDAVENIAKKLDVLSPVMVDIGDSDETFHEKCRHCIVEEYPCGLMLTPSHENENTHWERIRILSASYDNCLKLRGNTPSVQTNIIRLWAQDPNGDLLRDYEEAYPLEKDDVLNTVRLINESANDLELFYKNRHVRKTMEHTDLPHWTRKPIWDIHGMYLRERNYINKSRILEYFRTINPTFLNRMLKNREKEITKDRRESVVENPADDSCDE